MCTQHSLKSQHTALSGSALANGAQGWISVPRFLRFSSTNMLNAEHMKVLGLRSLEYRGLQHCYFLNSEQWQEAASSGISMFFMSPAIFSFRTHIFVSKVGCTALVAGLESASWLVVHCTFDCTYVAQVPQQTLVHRLTTLKELHSLSPTPFCILYEGKHFMKLHCFVRCLFC